MRWLNFILLVGIGALLALGNVWFAAARSTIPMGISDQLEDVEVRNEKHPGKDDVYLLKMKSGSLIHVDQRVAVELKNGDRLEKKAWGRSLAVGSRRVQLNWSADYQGMILAMPSILLVILITACSKPFLSDRETGMGK